MPSESINFLQNEVQILCSKKSRFAGHKKHYVFLDFFETKIRSLIPEGLEVEVAKFNVDNFSTENIYVHYKDGFGPPLILGAHFDVCENTPGADDNTSSVAVLLDVLRILKSKKNLEDFKYNFTLAFYSTEEPPWFGTKHMGSYHHAESLKRSKTKIKTMISLEMVGYYSEIAGSQDYPKPISWLKYIFGNKGNFLLLCTDIRGFYKVKKCQELLKKGMKNKLHTIVLPRTFGGVDFSDHRNFWHFGYHAGMLTDTAFYRNPNYHKISDVPESLCYDAMSNLSLSVVNLLKNLE